MFVILFFEKINRNCHWEGNRSHFASCNLPFYIEIATHLAGTRNSGMKKSFRLLNRHLGRKIHLNELHKKERICFHDRYHLRFTNPT